MKKVVAEAIAQWEGVDPVVADWMRSRHLGRREEAFTQNPNVKGGVPVFPGTRVPVRILHNWLNRGAPLDEFLDCYPTVTREKAVKVLECAFEQAIGPRDAQNHLR